MSNRFSGPSPLLARLLRAPDWLYRVHLGWILGKRFLALTHRGRSSGEFHRTVLEVISYDRRTNESVVASAWGTSADWYRNLMAEPALRVQTGGLDYVPQQRFLNSEEQAATASRFCREHPWEAKLMPRVLTSIGAPVLDGADAREQLSALPMVAFRPTD